MQDMRMKCQRKSNPNEWDLHKQKVWKEQHKETCMEPCMKTFICEQLPLIDFYFSFCSNCRSCSQLTARLNICHRGFLKLKESDSSFISSRFFRSICWELRFWALTALVSRALTGLQKHVPFACAVGCLLQPGHKWCCIELDQSTCCLMVWFPWNIFYVLKNVW